MDAIVRLKNRKRKWVGMNHKMYRICLLMVAVAATAGGVLYYCMCEKKVELSVKGTLVNQMQNTGSKVKRAGRQAAANMVNTFEKTTDEMKDAARFSGREVKRSMHRVGDDLKDAADRIRTAADTVGQEWKEAAQHAGGQWIDTVKSVGREVKEIAENGHGGKRG